MPTLNSIFSQNANILSSPALVLPSSSPTPNLAISYAQLAELVTSLRQQLAPVGLNKGDVVSMSLVNSSEFAAAFIGVANNRCISAPLNPAYSTQEVAFYLQDTQSKLLLVHAGSIASNSPAVQAARELKVPVAEVLFDGKGVKLTFEQGLVKMQSKIEGAGNPKEEDVALVLHTSGTTGRPKAVPLTHLNLATTMKNIINTYSLSPRDRTYLVMPLFHVHGLLAGFLAPLLSGGSVVVPPKFSAGIFWDEFKRSGSNWYTAVPTIHQILLRTPKPNPLPKIRFIRSCSSALSPATFAQVEEAFQAPVLEAYAMTEAAHQMTSNPLPPHPRKPGTVGLGQGVAIRILSLTTNDDVTEGEVAIKGLNVTPGYINNPSANASSFTPDGYFRTGDRGKLDEDGYLVLTGRLKELINKGGEKISPLEVDAVLLATEGVAEAVAFGVEDEKYGEKVWAAVVLKSGASITEADIIKSVKSKIAAFKVPDKIFILETIPKTATGKVQRKALAAKFDKEVKESNQKPKAKL
ncbi:acetyl-CoA synthetase-like protein [Meredithblackwellia eburnea MCA 4105]